MKFDSKLLVLVFCVIFAIVLASEVPPSVSNRYVSAAAEAPPSASNRDVCAAAEVDEEGERSEGNVASVENAASDESEQKKCIGHPVSGALVIKTIVQMIWMVLSVLLIGLRDLLTSKRYMISVSAHPHSIDAAMRQAITTGSIFELKWALFACGGLERFEDKGGALLFAAVAARQVAIVQYLLECGVSADGAHSLYGQSPRELAESIGSDSNALQIRNLLLRCTRLDCQFEWSNPLVLDPHLKNALQHGDTGFIEAALTHGIAIDRKFHGTGHTMLMHATVTGSAATVKWLLARGADPNALLPSSFPLEMANADLAIVHNCTGWTSLMVAVCREDAKMVTCLMEDARTKLMHHVLVATSNHPTVILTARQLARHIANTATRTKMLTLLRAKEADTPVIDALLVDKENGQFILDAVRSSSVLHLEAHLCRDSWRNALQRDELTSTALRHSTSAVLDILLREGAMLPPPAKIVEILATAPDRNAKKALLEEHGALVKQS